MKPFDLGSARRGVNAGDQQAFALALGEKLDAGLDAVLTTGQHDDGIGGRQIDGRGLLHRVRKSEEAHAGGKAAGQDEREQEFGRLRHCPAFRKIASARGPAEPRPNFPPLRSPRSTQP
jgi:hypothetical protein